MSNAIIHPNYPDFKPMLAGKFKEQNPPLEKLKNYPYITSPKVDGIRCVIAHDGTPYTRSLKPVANLYIRREMQALVQTFPELAYLDGEFIAGGKEQLTEPNIFQKTSSAVMSHGGEPEVTFWYFDSFRNPYDSYADRLQHISETVSKKHLSLRGHSKLHLAPLPFHLAHNQDELEALEDKYVTEGYEGICFRNPLKDYHFNRSSVSNSSQHLMKLTRWETNELTITSTEELEHNDNELFLDERGYAKRSTSKAGKVAGGTLGKFVGIVLNGPFAGQELRVGTGDGLTHALRAQLWEQRESLPGKLITFKWKAHGSKDAPRIPIFKAIRDPDDMS